MYTTPKLSQRCMFFVLGHLLLCSLYSQDHTNTTLVKSGEDFTLEKVDDTTFVWKRYRSDSDFVTQLITYSTESMTEKHGPYFNRRWDGSTVSQGRYFQDAKHGEWTENTFDTGYYQHGKREGTWYRFDHLDRLRMESYYEGGQEILIPTYYDTLGQEIAEEVFTLNQVVRLDELWDEGTLPIFGSTELHPSMTQKEIKAKSDMTMLRWIYQHIKYPAEARKKGNEGQVIVRFNIDYDGVVYDAHVIRGVVQSLDEEALRVVELMPRFLPGTLRGEPVRVEMNLPITFSLE